MNIKNKSNAIITIEKLRLVESELFRLSSKYGVKTVDGLDKLIAKGKLTEKKVGEDFFLFDHLLEEKETLEKKLKELSINKNSLWESLQSLLGLRKLNFQK